MEKVNYSYLIRLLIAIIGTLLGAVCLSLLPFPDEFAFYKPDLIPMVLVYWVLFIPQRVGLVYAWIFGFLLDTIFGVVLGTHAIGLVLIAYITIKLHQRLKIYPIWQQAIYVALLIFIFRLTFFILIYLDRGILVFEYIWIFSLISTFLFWPWLEILLRSYRRFLQIEM